jgi:acetyltransferase
LNYFLQNKKSVEYKSTSSIVLYLEEFSNGQDLVRIISQLSKYKSVAVLKSGKTSAGALAAKSHTGSMTGSWLVAEAALKRAGAIILEDLGDLFSFLELSRRPFSLTPINLGIISNAGGPAVLATDACYRLGLKLKSFNKKLSVSLPKLHIANPLDLIGDAKALDYKLALQNILVDKNFNTVLVVLSPQTSSEIEATAKEIALLAKKYPKKIIVTSFIGGKSLQMALNILSVAGVPNFSSPEEALRVLSFIDRAADNCLAFPVAKDMKSFNQKTIKDLSYVAAMNFLKKYGIKTVKTVSFDNSKSLKMPLVLKATGPDFIHKTDKRAIYLNINSEVELNEAKLALSRIGGDKGLNSIIAQEMLLASQEIIVSFKRDHYFGTILMVGAGGIYTEVLKDFSLLLPGISEKNILKSIMNLKIYPLLSGARGQNSLDIKSLVKVVLALQKMAWEYPDILEMEINPLILYKKGAIAADIRIIK